MAGSIESNKRRINFSDEYLEQINQINLICNDIFKIKGRIDTRYTNKSKKSSYRLEVGSIALNDYLHKTFCINRGIKKNLMIPNKFWENKEIMRWYLIGLYDADGTLPKNPNKCKQLFIDITLKDKALIDKIKEALIWFNINTLKPYCRKSKSPNSDYISTTWDLRIRKKEDMIKFLNEIGFYHPIKAIRVTLMKKKLDL